MGRTRGVGARRTRRRARAGTPIACARLVLPAVSLQQHRSGGWAGNGATVRAADKHGGT